MKVSVLLLFIFAVLASHASPANDSDEEEILQNEGLLRAELCEDVGGECIDKKKAKKCEGKIDKKSTCLGKTVCCISDGVTKPPKPTGEPIELRCEEFGGECISKKDKKKCKGEIDPMGKCKDNKEVCCFSALVTMPTMGPNTTGEPIDLRCEEIGGECMSKKDKKKCKGEIEPMGICKGKKDVCCFSTLVTMPTMGPKTTGEPIELRCEEIGGECMSKKDKKKCKGEIEPMGKCKGKKDICCFSTLVTMPTMGPNTTGEPIELRCEEIGGECMSKKDKKKCKGEIEPIGKCKGKKDVCCFSTLVTMPTIGPNTTGEPIELRCEEIGGECMSKKDKKKCKGEIEPMGKCKGKKDVCCFSTLVTMPTTGPNTTGEPIELRCEEIGGECMSKKDKKKCKGEIEPMGKCKGKKDVCCFSTLVTMPTMEPKPTGEPIELRCEEEIGGECMSKKDKKKCKGEIDPMGKCKGKKDVCCVLET